MCCGLCSLFSLAGACLRGKLLLVFFVIFSIFQRWCKQKGNAPKQRKVVNTKCFVYTRTNNKEVFYNKLNNNNNRNRFVWGCFCLCSLRRWGRQKGVGMCLCFCCCLRVQLCICQGEEDTKVGKGSGLGRKRYVFVVVVVIRYYWFWVRRCVISISAGRSPRT